MTDKGQPIVKTDLVRRLLWITAVAILLSPLFPAYAPDGSQFNGLFNKFTVTSNPEWQRQLDTRQ